MRGAIWGRIFWGAPSGKTFWKKVSPNPFQKRSKGGKLGCRRTEGGTHPPGSRAAIGSPAVIRKQAGAMAGGLLAFIRSVPALFLVRNFGDASRAGLQARTFERTHLPACDRVGRRTWRTFYILLYKRKGQDRRTRWHGANHFRGRGWLCHFSFGRLMRQKDIHSCQPLRRAYRRMKGRSHHRLKRKNRLVLSRIGGTISAGRPRRSPAYASVRS